MNLLDSIPGYRKAVEREAAIRDAAFLDLPESIAGIQAKPLTVRLFLILEGIGSPYVRGAQAEASDAARFLWAVSPLYKATDREARDRFVKQCRRLIGREVDAAIRAYVDEAFLDAPPATGADGEAVPFASWASALIDFLANQYSWSEDEILDMPLKRAWQYVRRIQKRNNPSKTLFNPSDKVRGDWLAKLNQMKGENGL